jgi:hypothetical protein
MCFHQRVRSISYDQFWPWIRRALKGGGGGVVGQSGHRKNKICFDKILIKNPYELIFSACLFMKYWAGLFAAVDLDMVKARVDVMLRISTEIRKRCQELQGPRLLLSGGSIRDEEEITELEEDQQTPPE